MDSKETFKKPKAKAKRKLTEKQLEALARGRQKRAEKLKAKLDKKADKDMVKEIKTQGKEKRVKIKEQQKIKKELNETREKKDDWRIPFKKRFDNIKNDTLDKIDDMKTFKSVKKYFGNIDLKKYNTAEDLKQKMRNDMTKINTLVNSKK